MSFLNDNAPNCDHDSGRLMERLPVPHLLDGLRILVLEDEFLIAMEVEQLCRDHGANEVVVARDLTEVDGRKIALQFDVAIVDLMLGGASTLEFAAGLRETGVPFVFASGYSDAHEIQVSFPEVRLVSKPYSGQDLVEAVALAYGRGSPGVETDTAASGSRFNVQPSR
ncbi:response regulator [Mesorhizobium sp. B2-4-12]|uniref:response regulator n=1 Tax=Mesorhizobium sp. B4-1-4 TaxID=2589888 RepID=UPI0011294A72|nr:response regulator [Mesorhizobium sp. B2-4-17]TPK96670.1 response regulator [Mesorhizobium sp. B2-4-12]